MKRSAFTLVEIIAVAIIIAMLMTTLHKLMSGTFSNLFKSQTKFTNLRSASIIMEYLKHDLRLAIVSSDDLPKVEPPGAQAFEFSFMMKENTEAKVTYKYADGLIERCIEGGTNRKISHAKVASFSIDLNKEKRYVGIKIAVDDENNELQRSGASLGNRVVLSAVMFPRFFKDSLDEEEKYWLEARKLGGQ